MLSYASLFLNFSYEFILSNFAFELLFFFIDERDIVWWSFAKLLVIYFRLGEPDNEDFLLFYDIHP